MCDNEASFHFFLRPIMVSVTGTKDALLHCSGRKEDDMVITIIIEMFQLHFPF